MSGLQLVFTLFSSFYWKAGINSLVSEAATRGVLWKKVFLEYSQNSQENPCPRVIF